MADDTDGGAGDPDAGTDLEDLLLDGDWSALCYAAALQWARAARAAGEPDWVIVHGTVWSARFGRRIAHAWCERGADVVDLALPPGWREVERDRYDQVLRPEAGARYTLGAAVARVLATGHEGPWDEPGPDGGRAPGVPELADGAYDLFGRYLDVTRDQFVLDLLRAPDPEAAAGRWCDIAEARVAYHDAYTGGAELPAAEERALVAALIAVAAGQSDPAALGVPVEVGRRLIGCYNGLGAD